MFMHYCLALFTIINLYCSRNVLVQWILTLGYFFAHFLTSNKITRILGYNSWEVFLVFDDEIQFESQNDSFHSLAVAFCVSGKNKSAQSYNIPSFPRYKPDGKYIFCMFASLEWKVQLNKLVSQSYLYIKQNIFWSISTLKSLIIFCLMTFLFSENRRKKSLQLHWEWKCKVLWWKRWNFTFYKYVFL